MTTVRLYANEKGYTSNDEHLIKCVEVIDEITNLGASTEDINRYTKDLANKIRRDLNIDRLIGFVGNGENSIVIFVYDILATDDNFHQQKFDEDRKEFYIEIETVIQEAV